MTILEFIESLENKVVEFEEHHINILKDLLKKDLKFTNNKSVKDTVRYVIYKAKNYAEENDKKSGFFLNDNSVMNWVAEFITICKEELEEIGFEAELIEEDVIVDDSVDVGQISLFELMKDEK